MTTHLGLLAAVAAAVATLTACGGGSDDGGAAAGSGGDLSIESPADGAEVPAAFTVEVSTGEELGPPESGAMHVHLYYDGADEDYDVVTSDSFEVEGLGSGEHTIEASLRHADHSAAGAEDTVTVTVAGDGGGGGNGGGHGTGGGGGYGTEGGGNGGGY